MTKLDLPARPTGTVPEQLEALWTYLFLLVERLNAEGEAQGRTGL